MDSWCRKSAIRCACALMSADWDLATHVFQCIIRIHGNFHKRKMSVHFVLRILTNSGQFHFIELCVCIFVFILTFFLSVYPLNCRRNWCAFMFIGCGMPEVSRKKATKHHSVHRMESRRSKKCVYLLFKNDLWCLYGANSVCLVRFLFAYFMHTTRLKWTRERKKGCYICKQFGILILNRSWLIHGKCFCHFCYCKSVTMRQNGIIYLHIGRLQSSLKRKNPRMCPFKL